MRRFQSLGIKIAVISFGFNSQVLASPYCFANYYKAGLAYKRLDNPGLQWGVNNIKIVSDIYPTMSNKRRYNIEASEQNLGRETDVKLSIIATFEGQPNRCSVDTRKGIAECGKLTLLPSTGKSDFDVPYGWNQGLQFARARLDGRDYYVVNGVHPIRYAPGQVGGNDGSDPVRIGGPPIIVNPNHPIYKEKCVNPFSKGSGIYVTEGYEDSGTATNAYVCVKHSICTELGTLTRISESSYLVPIMYQDGFMQTAANSFSRNSYYPDHMASKGNVEVFMRKSDIIPITFEYNVLAQVEKPSLGF